MQAFIPIPAYQLKSFREIVLIDPVRLHEWFGLHQQSPKVLCKTVIHGDLAAGWSLYVQENNSYTWLAGADASEGQELDSLDVIATIGHNLAIMPWQKLVFVCKGETCSGVSYIDCTGL